MLRIWYFLGVGSGFSGPDPVLLIALSGLGVASRSNFFEGLDQILESDTIFFLSFNPGFFLGSGLVSLNLNLVSLNLDLVSLNLDLVSLNLDLVSLKDNKKDKASPRWITSQYTDQMILYFYGYL